MEEERQESSLFMSFVNNIEEKLSDLVTLEIKTIVGDYRLLQDETVLPKKNGEFKIMKTKIGLLDGDVTTLMSNDLIQDKYAWLRDFHAGREEKGHEIIHKNIEAIKSLFELFKDTKGLNVTEENVDETEGDEIG